MKILVTGGAGFIGSNFARYALRHWSHAHVVVLDKLTYAGNMQNLHEVSGDPRFSFIHGDICSPDTVRGAMEGCTHVVNFAAETHVDRSILDAGAFVRTNVEGTRLLLEGAKDAGVERYLQVSTDEVYGEVDPPHRTPESAQLLPRSPYSASKASGDLMVGAYFATYGVPTLITRGSNTYGPYQYPEKLMPLFVTNALDGLPLPVYGDGMQMRDWLFVEDHCSGIATVLEHGQPGEIYNVGTATERPNMEVIERVIALTQCDRSLLRHVPDRPGHDGRYALDNSKLLTLNWTPLTEFDDGMIRTVKWYRENRTWWEEIKRGGGFQAYYQQQYERRLTESTA